MCIASLFNIRAVYYRNNLGIKSSQVGMSVGVQKMARSDIGSAGVAFSIDPDSGSNKIVIINSSHGLGEIVVSGQVIPDEFVVSKNINNMSSIIDKKLGNKEKKIIYGREGVQIVDNNKKNLFSLSDDIILQLASWVIKLEKYMNNKPVDIEWACDGKELYIVQCRPETVHSNKNHNLITNYKISKNVDLYKLKERIILKGISLPADFLNCSTKSPINSIKTKAIKVTVNEKRNFFKI